MARTPTAVATELATHQKVALGFLVGTASIVLLSAVATMILTLLARPAVTAPTPSPETGRTFQTG